MKTNSVSPDSAITKLFFGTMLLILTHAAAGEKPDTLCITARLTEIAGTFAANDLYNYVYIMKYSVVKVEKGAYTDKEILVGHYNPLIPRKKIKDEMDSLVDGDIEKFKVGDKHRLTLITPVEAAWDGAVEDEYEDAETEKYFALKAVAVK